MKVKELITNVEWESWWHKDRKEKLEIKREFAGPLTAKDFWRKQDEKSEPLIEARIPALSGVDQDKPWANVLKALIDLRYTP